VAALGEDSLTLKSDLDIIVTSHRTDFRAANDQNKPRNDMKENFLCPFLAVSRLLFYSVTKMQL
jgi:hypothetical protein